MQGEKVLFLLWPYWNLEPLKIRIDDIYSIKLTERRNPAGGVAAWSFSISFILFGAMSGLSAKYDEDYSDALIASSIGAGVMSLLGLATGAVVGAASKSNYNFYKMSNQEKINCIKKIMGI